MVVGKCFCRGYFLYPVFFVYPFKKICSPNSQNEDIQSPTYVKVICSNYVIRATKGVRAYP